MGFLCRHKEMDPEILKLDSQKEQEESFIHSENIGHIKVESTV
jgi:hypothetical protein